MKKTDEYYKKPPYTLDSVNNALRAIHMLRDSGAIRVIDLADRLHVARSTAHRTLSMLVFQGFAVQDDQQRYLAGPAMSAPVVTSQQNQKLTHIAQPILEHLQSNVDEVVNLAVRTGVHTRVLLTLGDHMGIGVDDRSGHVYPAHLSSAGRALLAGAPSKLLGRLYRSSAAEFSGTALNDRRFEDLLSHLNSTRMQGFAICDQAVQRKVSSIATGLFPGDGLPACAIVLLTSAPQLDELVSDTRKTGLLFAAKEKLERAVQQHMQPAAAE